jgi:diaminopropionate ammonia-lyase
MNVPPLTDLYVNMAPLVARKNRQPQAPQAFHRRLPGYAPTPVVDLPETAQAFGLGSLTAKIETERFGLPAFKILGASWAIYRELCRRVPGIEGQWETLDDLREAISPLGDVTFVAATDGNHGRAVAHMAALLGQRSHILVPDGMAGARIEAIEGEGATVEVVHGTYDDAIALSARMANETHLVISDTSWPGYEDVPRDVIDGYSTIFTELQDQLPHTPTQMVVQMGVGALGAAAIRSAMDWESKVVSVEPADAACILASLRAKAPMEVPGPHRSIMAGLNCGIPSPIAWPTLWTGIDLALAIPDDAAREAMRVLARAGVVAGETGAAGLGGLLSLAASGDWERMRTYLKLDERSHVLVLVTEGATDPAAWEAVTGQRLPG